MILSFYNTYEIPENLLIKLIYFFTVGQKPLLLFICYEEDCEH